MSAVGVANPEHAVLKLLESMSLQEAIACLGKAKAKVDSKLGIEVAKVKAVFHKTVVDIVGAESLARLPEAPFVQLGFEPGFKWVIDEEFPLVDPKRMPAPAVRGIDNSGRPFIAIRYCDSEDPTALKVELVRGDRGQQLLSCGGTMRESDFVRMRDLLDGKTINGDDRNLLCKGNRVFKMV